jgi:hypothetical protein
LLALFVGVTLLVQTSRASSVSYAAGAVDQQSTACNGSIQSGGSQATGQTFTAGLPGFVDQIDVALVKQAPTGGVTVQLRNVVGETPGTTVLGSATLDDALIPQFGTVVGSPLIAIPLATPAPVVAGTKYSFVLFNPNPASLFPCAFLLSATDIYRAGDAVTTFDRGASWSKFAFMDLAFRTYVSASLPSSPTPTGTTTATTTATVTLTGTATVTPTATPTPSTSLTSPNKDDSPRKLTSEQRQQRQLTNRSNKDDVHTEGDVVEVHLDGEPPYVVIGMRDGLQHVTLACGDRCPTIRVGDYLEAEGTKQDEQQFLADEIAVTSR